MSTRRRPSLKKALLTIAGIAVLGACFASYLQPSFMFDIANRIMLCF